MTDRKRIFFCNTNDGKAISNLHPLHTQSPSSYQRQMRANSPIQTMNGLFVVLFSSLFYYHSITIDAFVHNHQPIMIPSSSSSLSWSKLTASAKQKSSQETSTANPSTKSKTKRPLYSFVEARRIARGHGFGSQQEFLDYDCAGAYQLPKNADQVWHNDWTSWDDFLGVPLEFQQAREVAREKV